MPYPVRRNMPSSDEKSAYGSFSLCHLQRGEDENALISYGIL